MPTAPEIGNRPTSELTIRQHYKCVALRAVLGIDNWISADGSKIDTAEGLLGIVNRVVDAMLKEDAEHVST